MWKLNLFLTYHQSSRHFVTETGVYLCVCVCVCVLVVSWPTYSSLIVCLLSLQCLTMAMRRPWGVPLSAWKEHVTLQRARRVLCCPAVLYQPRLSVSQQSSFFVVVFLLLYVILLSHWHSFIRTHSAQIKTVLMNGPILAFRRAAVKYFQEL